jgi:hypothetical protein
MNNDFEIGVIICVLVLTIALLWTVIVYLRAVIRNLKFEIEKLKSYIYELIDGAGRSDNQGRGNIS